MYSEIAIENYRIGHYNESAMMFLSLLDYRLNVRFVEYLKKNKQVDDSNALSCLYVEYLKQRRTNKSRKKGAENSLTDEQRKIQFGS